MAKKLFYLVIAGLTLSALSLNAADSKKLIEGYGWMMGKQSIEAVSAEFGFTEAEKKILANGFKDGVDLKQSPIDLQKSQGELQQYLQDRAAKQRKASMERVAKQSEQNKEKAKQYFSKLSKNRNVKKTDSGLYYEILKNGNGKRPAEDSTVKVHYVGKLINGEEFDSSAKRGQPSTFQLDRVIPGFKEGLQHVAQGGKIRLHIPSDLGYGDNEIPGIPPGSALVFEVEMIEVL